jgi:hypothetical protein
MKRFLAKSSALLLIVVLSVFGLKLSIPVKKNYNSAFVDKLQALSENKDKKKIVLIGGSSVGWGLSAEQIEKATNIPTFNLGHHAGFGLLDFQDLILSCLQPEDIVVFSPEWSFYENPEEYDKATLDDLYQNADYLDLTDRNYLIVRSIFLRNLNWSPSEERDTSDPYIYDCLNNQGDIITHCALPAKGPKKYDVNLQTFDLEKFKSTFQYINHPNYILLFPPTQDSTYSRNKQQFQLIEQRLNQDSFIIMDSIQSNVYEQGDFFDSEYHLTCDARKYRTEKVIRGIQNLKN